jgi:Domain of unknown function (DUF4032)
MVIYQLDYVVDEVLKNMPTQEQLFLKKYLNEDFEKKEAKYLWERIADHKWYVSERLKRDVGFRVAAVDYIENFYEPNSVFGNKNKPSGVWRRIFRPVGSGLRSYFVAKSKILPQ